MSSERARERDVHRYYQTWLDSSGGFNRDASSSSSSPDTRHHRDGTILRPSNDKALIAFAQLGCLRLRAKRSVITLISTTRQYILAEATKTISLETGFPEEDEGDELWFGNASLPRSQGVSAAALDPPLYIAYDDKDRQHAAPALVIPDLLQHQDYKHFPIAGNGVSFYCGVPLVSKSGYHIGAYTVSDDKPRDGVCRSELLFMQEMARIVMTHLEVVYNDAARYRGEKLVTGLGQFLEGMVSISEKETQEDTKLDDGNPDPSFQDVTRQFMGMAITNADPRLLGQTLTSQTGQSLQSATPVSKHASQENQASPIPSQASVEPTSNVMSESDQPTSSAEPTHSTRPAPTITRPNPLEAVFGRAAKILRQCTSADGVIFFDATSTNVTRRCGTSEFEGDQASGAELSNTEGQSNSDLSEHTDNSTSSTESDVSVGHQGRHQHSSSQKCEMLGYALDVSPASTATTNTIKTLGLTERVLRRFIRRYPKGKVFYFTESGEISASENEKSEGADSSDASTAVSVYGSRRGAGAITERMIATELIHAMPGARNIIWLPLWDFSKQRWSAGSFLWSRRPERLLAAQDDLTYLKTFGNSIMIDIARLDAQSADEAKATFIANISHELRSPLHGILGSTEFLQDTALDGFQSSMARAVETCAKTLLDTVEHVLDYSKISQMSNKLSKRNRKRLRNTKYGPRSMQQTNLAPSLVNDVDLASVLEEAVEAVYAGQTFRSAWQNHDAKSMATDFDAAMRNLPATADGDDPGVVKGVRVLLEISKSERWRVRTQPGAIRRIVMNIVGNALKYTDRGSITISMTGSDESHHGEAYKAVNIKVKDSGRGMSAKFLQNHAFTPFSQESYLSAGTGLGLSIVRQIVSSLGGRIELDSEKNVGTEISVHLTLPRAASAPPSDSYDNVLQSVVKRTSNMSMCIINPNAGDDQSTVNYADKTLRASLRNLATAWFGLKTTEAASMDGQFSDVFIYPEPPPITYLLEHHGHPAVRKEVPLIIITTNAFESASLAANGINQLTELGRVLEVISQPCGPHKLARALQRCFARLRNLDDFPDRVHEDRPLDPHVIERTGETSQHAQIALPEQLNMEPSSKAPLTNGEHKMKKEGRPSLSHRDTGRPSSDDLTPAVSVVPPDTAEQNLWKTPPTSPQAVTPLSEVPRASRLPPILLVDDNPVNLQLLVAFVKKSGYPYVTAQNGLEATEAFEEAIYGSQEIVSLSRPDNAHDNNNNNVAKKDLPGILDNTNGQKQPFKYIVMDISMPVMDGIEATRQIRQMERRNNIRQGEERSAVIIALTGLGVETTRNEMLSAGADYYLCKPIRFRELQELFNEGNA